MIYADTDFFMALMKKSDWLKESAERLLAKYKDQIWTSPVTMIEVLLIVGDLHIDPERAIMDVLNIAQLRGADYRVYLQAARYMKYKNVNVFDSLHAALCGHDGPIISSDRVFDKLGMKRIRLEQQGDSVSAGLPK